MFKAFTTRDRARHDTREQRRSWAHSRRAERFYARQLRRLALQVGAIVTGCVEAGQPPSMIEHMLHAYADLIGPWAEAAAASMLADVARRDALMWAQHSRAMSRALADEIQSAPTGDILRQLMKDQVRLIKSLPLAAAERVHELALKGLEEGSRGQDIVAEIMRTGQVTRSRAELIARTETGRAASNLTEARAKYVGSTHYVWRSAEDSDVRDRHKKHNGKVFSWDNPPKSEPNLEPYHPGAGPNCRCYAEPIITEY